jgi:hypothetical protein
MRAMTRAALRWLPLGLAVTMTCGIVYVVAQQTYRQGANDPQVAMARGIAAGLQRGEDIDGLVGTRTVDPSTSLSPFVMVFDAKQALTRATIELGGKVPVPPAGVLDAAKARGENRVTWQPRPDARIASVIVPVAGGRGGYVLAGRSLKEAEERVSNLTLGVGVGWIATMIATFLATAFAERWIGGTAQ